MKLDFRIYLALITTIMSLTASAQGTFFLSYSNNCSVEKPNALITLQKPDGSISTLVDELKGVYQQDSLPCEHGKYSLLTVIRTKYCGNDSLRRSFTVNEKEFVDCRVTLEHNVKDRYASQCNDSIFECDIEITKLYEKEDGVNIRFIKYNDDRDADVPGPLFIIKNNTRDTLCGEWLPGYFWGAVARIDKGKRLFYKVGYLCSSWVDSPPLYPDSIKYSWIGSLGNILRPGRYRYRVRYYKKGNKTDENKSETKEQADFRWFARLDELYSIYCDFEVKEVK